MIAVVLVLDVDVLTLFVGWEQVGRKTVLCVELSDEWHSGILQMVWLSASLISMDRNCPLRQHFQKR